MNVHYGFIELSLERAQHIHKMQDRTSGVRRLRTQEYFRKITTWGKKDRYGLHLWHSHIFGMTSEKYFVYCSRFDMLLMICFHFVAVNVFDYLCHLRDGP